MPDVEVPDGTTPTVRSLSMAFEGATSRDRMNCDLGGGWADGSTAERQGTYGDPSNVPDYRADAAGTSADSDGSTMWIALSGVLGLVLGAGVVWIVMARRSA